MDKWAKHPWWTNLSIYKKIPTRINACCNFHENVMDSNQNTVVYWYCWQKMLALREIETSNKLAEIPHHTSKVNYVRMVLHCALWCDWVQLDDLDNVFNYLVDIFIFSINPCIHMVKLIFRKDRSQGGDSPLETGYLKIKDESRKRLPNNKV